MDRDGGGSRRPRAPIDTANDYLDAWPTEILNAPRRGQRQQHQSRTSRAILPSHAGNHLTVSEGFDLPLKLDGANIQPSKCGQGMVTRN
jgi:hypothetical protein